MFCFPKHCSLFILCRIYQAYDMQYYMHVIIICPVVITLQHSSFCCCNYISIWMRNVFIPLKSKWQRQATQRSSSSTPVNPIVIPRDIHCKQKYQPQGIWKKVKRKGAALGKDKNGGSVNFSRNGKFRTWQGEGTKKAYFFPNDETVTWLQQGDQIWGTEKD